VCRGSAVCRRCKLGQGLGSGSERHAVAVGRELEVVANNEVCVSTALSSIFGAWTPALIVCVWKLTRFGFGERRFGGGSGL
jgi:hypothetical protein